MKHHTTGGDPARPHALTERDVDHAQRGDRVPVEHLTQAERTARRARFRDSFALSDAARGYVREQLRALYIRGPADPNPRQPPCPR